MYRCGVPFQGELVTHSVKKNGHFGGVDPADSVSYKIVIEYSRRAEG